MIMIFAVEQKGGGRVMLDELRNLFLRALKCDDGITAIVLVNEWNEAVKQVQKVFDNMTDKASNCPTCGARMNGGDDDGET